MFPPSLPAKSCSLSRSTRAAFSLPELVVSVLVLAVLLVLAFSVSRAVSASVAGARCTSNLRHIGNALMLHATDHRGLLPPTAGFLKREWVQAGWAEFLQRDGYLSDGLVAFCPMLPPPVVGKGINLSERMPGTNYSLGHFTYGLRSDHPGKIPPPYPVWTGSWTNFTWTGKESAPVQLRNVASPARSIMISDSYSNAYGKPVSSYRYDLESRVWSGVEFRHSGRTANHLFLDGHVAALTHAQIKLLFEEEDRNAAYFDGQTFHLIR